MTFDFEDPGNSVDVTFWKISTCFVSFKPKTSIFIIKVFFLANGDISSDISNFEKNSWTFLTEALKEVFILGRH